MWNAQPIMSMTLFIAQTESSSEYFKTDSQVLLYGGEFFKKFSFVLSSQIAVSSKASPVSPFHNLGIDKRLWCFKVSGWFVENSVYDRFKVAELYHVSRQKHAFNIHHLQCYQLTFSTKCADTGAERNSQEEDLLICILDGNLKLVSKIFKWIFKCRAHRRLSSY